jgi:thymidylate kinase
MTDEASAGRPDGPRRIRGRVVAIVGPDGTGKTGLADRLEEWLRRRHWVIRVHHVYRLLPGSAAAQRPTGKPHAQTPYPAWLAAVKVAYLFVGHMARWLVTIRPHVRRGGWVIVERGWSDMVVDPRRYRLSGTRLARRLGALTPTPDRTLVLDAPADVVHARRDELSIAELDRQLDAWRSIATSDPRAVVLDASLSASEVAAAAIQSLEALDGSTAGTDPAPTRWVRLPPFGPQRWTLPASPSRISRAAMMVHQPMRLRARGTWELARAFAAVGGLHLMPTAPEPTLREALADHIPPGGTVGVAHLPRRGRQVGLIVDRHGRPHALAKMAMDPAGREKLAREASSLQRFRTFVEAPLRAPRLLEASDGLIVLEAAPWTPRLRPWILEPDLAAAIGRFHRCSTNSDGTGPTHGDFAPWNILQTADGWFLVDWEDATEDGPPFWDPIHYLIQSASLLGRPHAREVREGVRGRGPVGEALAAYAHAAQVPIGDAGAALGSYLVASQADLNPARTDGRRGLATRKALLVELGSEL